MRAHQPLTALSDHTEDLPLLARLLQAQPIGQLVSETAFAGAGHPPGYTVLVFLAPIVAAAAVALIPTRTHPRDVATVAASHRKHPHDRAAQTGGRG